MRFAITMNVPVQGGALAHRIVCEHPAESLKELTAEIESSDLLIVEEFFIDKETKEVFSNGKIALNHLYIAKVKEL